jgi:hypothetical protein
MDMMQDFNDQMEYFVEQKRGEDALKAAVNKVKDAAASLEENGLCDYKAKKLINALTFFEETFKQQFVNTSVHCTNWSNTDDE